MEQDKTQQNRTAESMRIIFSSFSAPNHFQRFKSSLESDPIWSFHFAEHFLQAAYFSFSAFFSFSFPVFCLLSSPQRLYYCSSSSTDRTHYHPNEEGWEKETDFNIIRIHNIGNNRRNDDDDDHHHHHLYEHANCFTYYLLYSSFTTTAASKWWRRERQRNATIFVKKLLAELKDITLCPLFHIITTDKAMSDMVEPIVCSVK